ncbi:hypothetical protein CWI38_0699p0010 [Hamiltosporidium tvaerminnensis]|uniref:Uncharacterized protein n=1 Tax=Hamiltosporidium tvaerminnensis TaxID=1176355 RepID=A0A4Q9LVI7_9MICR|nr:hypothetical protein CWI38_0699p0010 [Hamiltosporidium tvaerminnensis]
MSVVLKLINRNMLTTNIISVPKEFTEQNMTDYLNKILRKNATYTYFRDANSPSISDLNMEDDCIIYYLENRDVSRSLDVNNVLSLCYSNDKKLVVCKSDGEIIVFDIESKNIKSYTFEYPIIFLGKENFVGNNTDLSKKINIYDTNSIQMNYKYDFEKETLNENNILSKLNVDYIVTINNIIITDKIKYSNKSLISCCFYKGNLLIIGCADGNILIISNLIKQYSIKGNICNVSILNESIVYCCVNGVAGMFKYNQDNENLDKLNSDEDIQVICNFDKKEINCNEILCGMCIHEGEIYVAGIKGFVFKVNFDENKLKKIKKYKNCDFIKSENGYIFCCAEDKIIFLDEKLSEKLVLNYNSVIRDICFSHDYIYFADKEGIFGNQCE